MSHLTSKYDMFTAVDVGSYSTKMKIAEVNADGHIKILENIRKFVNIGKDTFTHGFIRHEHAEYLCTVLKNFKKLMNEYNADRYRIVATSAFREADNRDYILDYIYMKTGFKIDVISEPEERFFTYNALMDKMDIFPDLKNESTLIVDIGSGGVEVTLFNAGSILFTQNIKIGALRLKEILSNLERKTLNFPNLIGEFIDSEIDTIKDQILRMTVKNYLCISPEIQIVHNILGRNRSSYNRRFMPRKSFYSIYHQMVGKSRQQIIEQFNLDPDSVETLLPALMVYERFLSFTGSDRIYTPEVSLGDGLIRYMVDKRFGFENRAFSEKDIIMSVKKLGERYAYDARHAAYVEKMAVLLFDCTRTLHGYSAREKLMLQIAAIAHEFGKYISIKSYSKLSHDILLNSEILGLPKRDILLIANIVKFHPAYTLPMENSDFLSLDYSDRITISKLTAFMQIADSLDKSRKQKLSDVKVTLSDNGFTIRAESGQDTLLEEWEFERKRYLFKEVFGMEPVLKIKRR